MYLATPRIKHKILKLEGMDLVFDNFVKSNLYNIKKNMANVENFEVKSARKKTVNYEEGFSWTIEGFEKWWSSIDLDQQVRSKVFEMEVDRVQHQFQLSVFKYLEYDGIVDSHTEMLSLSLF